MTLAKKDTCRAITMRGQRCECEAEEPKELPQLCWTHARALENRNRTPALQLVPAKESMK